MKIYQELKKEVEESKGVEKNELPPEHRHRAFRKIHKRVTEMLNKRKRKPKYDGHFFSQVPFYDCIKREVFDRLIYGKYLKYFKYEDKTTASLKKIFDIGKAVHSYWQNIYLGPSGILYGDWVCTRCQAVHSGRMPKHPCTCGWLHVSKEGGIVPCKTDCKYPYGFNSVSRNCGGCWFANGKYEHKETRVIIDLDISDYSETLQGKTQLRGYVDGMVKLDGIMYVLDLKTMDSFKFTKLEEIKPFHKEQVNVAMAKLGIANGLVVYINKNSGAIKEFPFEFDQAMYDETLRKVVTVEKYVIFCYGEIEKRCQINPVSDVWDVVKKTFAGKDDLCLPLSKCSDCKYFGECHGF